MTDHYVLVPAPVLGPASWQPAAAELRKLTGGPVTVPSLAGFADGGPPYVARLARACAAQVSAADDRLVLVVHSGAGPLAAELALRLAGGGGVAVVFADAGLPAADGPTPVVGGEFLPYLRQIARGGVVPPWQEWWPDADPAEVFPSEVARAAVVADARPLPLAFFEEVMPGGLALRDCGYLLFSAGYQEAAAEARRRGWPVIEVPGGHLHMLEQPAQVAEAIAELAGRLAGGGGQVSW